MEDLILLSSLHIGFCHVLIWWEQFLSCHDLKFGVLQILLELIQPSLTCSDILIWHPLMEDRQVDD
jgi:hypothetical protein